MMGRQARACALLGLTQVADASALWRCASCLDVTSRMSHHLGWFTPCAGMPRLSLVPAAFAALTATAPCPAGPARWSNLCLGRAAALPGRAGARGAGGAGRRRGRAADTAQQRALLSAAHAARARPRHDDARVGAAGAAGRRRAGRGLGRPGGRALQPRGGPERPGPWASCVAAGCSKRPGLQPRGCGCPGQVA